MRMSKLFSPTLREVPADAEVISHQLMLRAGMIRKVAAGIYNYLPLGYRVIRKVENIIRDELNNAGAQEILMPAVIPAELWQRSGRWEFYGKELLRFKDRKNSEFCLGPTHEEVITDMVSRDISSYRELPITLYQIQAKFRDEIRPRFGLMRGREFIMKDAYSFHDTLESLDEEYQNMYKTYCRIFERCGLDYKVVEADSGNIGGSSSQEFMVLAPTGEDLLISCEKCDYAANVEAAFSQPDQAVDLSGETAELAEVETPNKKTIEEVTTFLNTDARQMIKTLIYWYKKGDQEDKVIVLLRGDRQINEIKLKNYLAAEWVMLAEDAIVEKALGVEPGFCGPINVVNCRIIADLEVKFIKKGIVGANKKDFHLINVLPGRDFEIKEETDLRLAVAADFCAKCGAILTEARGIEVGHIFKLGIKYSESMKALYLDKNGQEKPYIMGCYGIGVGRTAAAAIEQNNDENGIIWPLTLAPFQVAVIPVKSDDQLLVEAAEKIYLELIKAGVEVLFDDREGRLGMKLKDQELIGIPMRIVVGPKGLEKGEVEFRLRTKTENEMIKIENILQRVNSELIN